MMNILSSSIINNDMRKESNQVEIKQELSKFINLLQTDFHNAQHETPPENGTLRQCLHKNLSIIYSASQPESSSLDKQNSNPSANRSFESEDKLAETEDWQRLIGSLMATHLSTTQLKLVQKVGSYTERLRIERDQLSVQFATVKSEWIAEKKANDEMLGVLVKMDEQQKQLWNSSKAISDKYNEAVALNKQMEEEVRKLSESLVALQKDSEFMRKLIFHANQNYECLEKKCRELENRGDLSPQRKSRKNQKESSVDNLLRSSKTKKNGYSPTHSELSRTPSRQNFQDVYRKMIIRTLKFKGKNQ